MKTSNIFRVLLVLAGASVPAFVFAGTVPGVMAPFKPLPQPPVNASASASSSASAVPAQRGSLPASVLDRPASVQRYGGDVPVVRPYVRSASGSLVLSATYDKGVICSRSVFSDDCLSASLPAGVSGIKVLRSR